MKLPFILTLVILAAGSFWGVQGNRHLTTLREKHRLVLKEAAALGVPADLSKPFFPTKVAKRTREDAEVKVRDFTERLVTFAKEMKDMEKTGNPPDEASRRRMMEMMDGMLSLNGEELKLLIAGMKDRKDMDDGMRNGLVSFLIMMLSERHPEAALALFTESSDMLGDNPMGKHALSTALSQWAKDQPLEALKWINANSEKHPELVSDDTKVAVIAGAAHNDFTLALQLLGELKVPVEFQVMHQISQAATTPEQQTELLNALRQQAENATDKAEAGKILDQGLKSLVIQVSQTGYEKTMQWLQSANLTATEKEEMVGSIYYHLTKADTGKWLDWLSSQTLDGKKSENTTRNLVRQWTENDYKAAGEWLARAPAGPVKETATRSYLETIAPYEPEVAVQWAETLPAEKRKDAIKDIHQALKRKDKAAAEDFAARHGVDAKE
jgi:hypothetical protein